MCACIAERYGCEAWGGRTAQGRKGATAPQHYPSKGGMGEEFFTSALRLTTHDSRQKIKGERMNYFGSRIFDLASPSSPSARLLISDVRILRICDCGFIPKNTIQNPHSAIKYFIYFHKFLTIIFQSTINITLVCIFKEQ